MSSEGAKGGSAATPAEQTSLHVRRAREGDGQSVEWIVEKFTPLLLASARYRLPGSLRSLYDPEDLVNEVWLIALPKLDRLRPREGRYTPVLLKFLSSSLVNKINTLMQKHILGKPGQRRSASPDETDGLGELSKTVTGVVTRVARQETRDAVWRSLDRLGDPDRELIVLRGIEQHSYREIAAVVGGEPKSLAVRYCRALQKLRSELPDSVFTEFENE